jgi:hypothetical protein
MRRTHHTILLVGEGDGEDQLARVIRDLYLPRNCGTTLTRKNAHGFGGAGALTRAIELKSQTAYDTYAVMVDTDQHWGDAERLLATQHDIATLENHPCLEAVLLDVDGHKPSAVTAENKRVFQRRYGGPAGRDGVIRRHFTREKFDAARARIEAIDRLLRLIRR